MTKLSKNIGIIALALSLFIGGVTFAYTYSTGYYFNHNTSSDITDIPFDQGLYNAGYTITNNDNTYNYFIPTKTESEWDSFVSGKPSTVEIISLQNNAECGPISTEKTGNGHLATTTESDLSFEEFNTKSDTEKCSAGTYAGLQNEDGTTTGSDGSDGSINWKCEGSTSQYCSVYRKTRCLANIQGEDKYVKHTGTNDEGETCNNGSWED